MTGTHLDLIRQAAAIPIQGDHVCLITSKSGKRWGVPKGHLEFGITARETALQEAWEEAGLTGFLARDPIGTYTYEKLGNSYHVTVFLMHVIQADNVWPEFELRHRRWVEHSEADGYALQSGLAKILRTCLARNHLSLV